MVDPLGKGPFSCVSLASTASAPHQNVSKSEIEILWRTFFWNSKPYNWINYSKLNDECHLIFWPTVMWAEINLFDVGLTSDFHVFMAEYWCSKVAPGSFFFTSSRVSAWWVVVVALVVALVSCPQSFRDWRAVRWLVFRPPHPNSHRPAEKEEAQLKLIAQLITTKTSHKSHRALFR